MVQRSHVGVNGLFVLRGHGGGIENYFRNVMRELPALDRDIAYTLFANRQSAGMFEPGAAQNTCEVVYPMPQGPLRPPARLAYDNALLPLQVKRRHLDVLFSPAFTAPIRVGAASVVTIHDMRHTDLPQENTSLTDRLFLKSARHSARSAAHILAVSAYTKRRIVAVYHIPPEQVTVTHLAADPAYFGRVSSAEAARVHAAHSIRAPYILSVASLELHKNLDTLIAAYALLRQQGGTTAQLVLTGLRSSGTAMLEEKIRSAGLAGEVILTGWVAGEDLPALYQGATAFAFPSRYEGFGLPVLEAMASGVPVVTTTATSLPEVAGGAALLVDPEDAAELAGALGRLVGDEGLRREMSGRGRERAAQFSWKKTAEGTLSAFHRALSPRIP